MADFLDNCLSVVIDIVRQTLGESDLMFSAISTTVQEEREYSFFPAPNDIISSRTLSTLKDMNAEFPHWLAMFEKRLSDIVTLETGMGWLRWTACFT